MRRRRLTRSRSKRIFRKGANKIHRKNLRATVMRGGYRL